MISVYVKECDVCVCWGQGAFTDQQQLREGLPGFMETLAAPTTAEVGRALGAAVTGLMIIAYQHR